jgi:hypothetical protein
MTDAGRLIDRMGTLDAEHDARSASALARVVRWEWATQGARRDVPLPFWQELDGGRSDDRTLRRPPSDRSRGIEYGYDDAGAVVITRGYRADGTLEYERLAVAQESVTYRHEATAAPVVVGVTWTERDNKGRTARYIDDHPGRERSDFVPTWDGDRLIALDVTIEQRGVVVLKDTMRYRYDQAGELVAIRAEDQRQVIYRRPLPNMRGAVAEVVSGLSIAIAGAAARMQPDGPVGAILIGIDFADPLPPPVGLISPGERDSGDGDWHALLDVDPELDDALAELVAAVRAHVIDVADEALLGRIVRAIAGRLPDDLAPGDLRRADGFAVIVREVD